MNEPRLRQVQCLDPRGLHRMAYWEWGDAHNPRVLVCVHGLSRQGRDFDTLARDLCSHYRVICPDVVGRGRSDWLVDAMGYGLPMYVADMVTLLARLDTEAVDWVGTSMGGLIGLALAALERSPIRQLVLNDVGPVVQPAFVQRLSTYLGVPVRWPTVDAAADALQAISSGFGPHTRDEWLTLTRPQLVADELDGQPGFKPHYDPAIAVAVRAMTPAIAAAGQAMLWQMYDRIAARTLLLRGEQSDLLDAETAQLMSQRGPRAAVHTFAGVGHAPTLVAAEQRAAVRRFLIGP
ncbi:MAG: alpha/beta hydrolase [Rubrivivax sp.]|nr:alpha/beta hydrolase [Rubrivivax sp.]